MTPHSTLKRRAIAVAAVIIMAAGLAFILYPYASNRIIKWQQQKVIANYQKEVTTADTLKLAEMFDKAMEYNQKLQSLSAPLATAPRQLTEYTSLLRADRNNIMGYITIDKIGIHLPMRHGTQEQTLQTALGHLEGTSLPVGGPGSHTVLVGHSGLPSAKLLTDIDQLRIGDTLSLTVLSKTHYYKVDSILTVLPQEVEEHIRIDPNQDYLTLMTCTPYGVNTHRLLVRAQSYTPMAPEQVLKSEGAAFSQTLLIGALAGIVTLIVIKKVWNKRQKNKKYKK